MDSAALSGAINNQAGRLATLESQVAQLQQRLDDKADAASVDGFRCTGQGGCCSCRQDPLDACVDVRHSSWLQA